MTLFVFSFNGLSLWICPVFAMVFNGCLGMRNSPAPSSFDLLVSVMGKIGKPSLFRLQTTLRLVLAHLCGTHQCGISRHMEVSSCAF